MKNLFYSLFALFFSISRILPIKRNRVVLLSPHKGGAHDSLGVFEEYLKNKGKYEIIRISSPEFKTSSILAALKSVLSSLDFFLIKSGKLARAEYVFMNDNFMPMAQLNFSAKTVITQLWHAEGAFKKFSLLLDLSEDIEKREKKAAEKLTYVTCTSKNLVKIYSDAFGVEESKILPIGSPRLDYLLSEHNTKEIREEFDRLKPEFKGKKLVLYAPTFRDNPEKDAKISEHFDLDKISSSLPDDYAVLVKLHPQIHGGKVPGSSDVTFFDIGKLTLICDIVITDYSSVCMDFALLDKPCIFFAYDLEEYAAERSFCFGFENYVPGEIVKDTDALIDAIKNPKDINKDAFEKFNFDYKDVKNCERLFDAVIKS